MISLDSLKLKIPRESGWDLNLDYLDRMEGIKAKKDGIFDIERTKETTYEIPKDSLPKGLNKVVIEPSGSLRIEMSSKILKSNYLQGITENTIEQVWDSIQKIDCVRSFPKDLIQYSSILKCDCSTVLYLDQPISPIIDAFHFYPINPKYRVHDVYTGESLRYKHTGSSVSESILFYDKRIEMNKKEKGDPSFLNSVLSKVDPKKNLLRVETNFTKYSDLRNVFKVKNNINYVGVSLIGVLQSKENPLVKIYDKVMVSNNESILESRLFTEDKINDLKGKTFEKINSEVGLETIILDNQKDLKRIREYYKMLDVSKSSISNNIPRIKEIILKLNQGYDTKSNFERVKEIRELLKVA